MRGNPTISTHFSGFARLHVSLFPMFQFLLIPCAKEPQVLQFPRCSFVFFKILSEVLAGQEGES